MKHVILVPCPGMGHANPMMQLARRLTEHKFDSVCQFVVTLVIPIWERDSSKLNSAETNRIRIEPIILSDSHGLTAMFTFNAHADCLLVEAINSLDNDFPPPSALVADVFVWGAAQAAVTLNLPFYNFMPSPLTCQYLVFKQLASCQRAVRDAEYPGVPIPGCGMARGEDMIRVSARPEFQEMIAKVVQHSQSARGTLVNDIESAYPPELLAACAEPSPSSPLWKIYCAGPLALYDARVLEPLDDELQNWLDSQTPRSVLFVALGSVWDLPSADLVELAHALRALGRPVLWALRRPLRMAEDLAIDKVPSEPVDEDGLPLNFRESLDGDKFYLAPWVNQPVVLCHAAVGGFLLHCGWNSIVEALTFAEGVPLACLPCGAEQGINARICTEVWGVGVRLWFSRDTDDLKRTKLAQDLNHIFVNPELRANAAQLHRKFQAAGVNEGAVLSQDFARFVQDLGASIQPEETAALL